MLKESPTENSDTIQHVHAADTPKVKKKIDRFCFNISINVAFNKLLI